jgi:branched-chain amino acid transport system substrate-binding protein
MSALFLEKKISLVVQMGILLASTLAAMSPALGDVRIGVILPFTGPSTGLRSMLALEDWPTTIGGEKITLIKYDDQGDPGRAAINAKRLVTEHKVDVLVSNSSPNEWLAVDGVARENDVAHLVIRAVTSAAFGSAVASDAAQSLPSVMFEHMKSHAVRRLGFLGYDDGWGDLWLKELQNAETRHDLQLGAAERFARGTSSVDIPVRTFVNAKIDALLIAATGASAVTAQLALREHGYKGLIYHTHGSATDNIVDIPVQDAANAIFPATQNAIFSIVAKQTLPRERRTNALDAVNILKQLIPSLLQKDKPGSTSFRKALRQATQVAAAKSLHGEPTWTLVTFDNGVWASTQ